MNNYNLSEGVEYGDLKRLIDPVMSIDEFRSKMGEDKDIIVVGLTVFGKEPAEDLTNFVEKSYDWVLDADISSGETSDGNFIVFVELERTPKACEKIYKMVEDILNLTEQEMEDWSFTYYNGKKNFPFTLEDLKKHIISTPETYEQKIDTDVKESAELNSLRAIAGVKVQPLNLKDDQLLEIQRAAGIR